MHGNGRSRAVDRLRRWAVVPLLAVVLLAGSVFQTQDRAHAFVVAPLPVALPGSLAALASVASGSGTVVGTAATTTAVAGGAVALAPVAVAAAAVLAVGGAVWLGWKWKQGHSPAYADPPATAPTNGPPGTWTQLDSGANERVCLDEPSSLCVYGEGRVYTAAAPDYGRRIGLRAITGKGQQTGSFTIVGGGRRWGEVWSGTNSCGRVTIPDSAAGSGNGQAVASGNFACLTGQVATRFLTGPNIGTQPTYVLGDPPPAAGPSGTTTVTTTPRSRCSDGSTVSGTAVTYTGSTPAEDLPPILAPACPAGTQRVGFDTPSTGAGGAVVTSPVTWSAPTVPAQYADCAPGGAAAPCQVTLVKRAPDGQTVNCTGTTACPSPRRQPEPDGSTYDCRWGPYALPLADCDVVPTNPPGAAVEVVTGADPDGCVFGWSWNPVDWVLEPIKCALTWAFVPSPGFVSGKVAGVRDTWAASGPASYLGAFGGLVVAVGDIGDQAAGCKGPRLHVEPGGYVLDLYPLDACPGTVLGRVAPVVRVLLLIGLYLGGAIVAARVLAGSLGLQLPSFGERAQT